MTTKHVLTATCPNCGTVLQVKTRSAEKVVPCPKCQAAVTVAAPTDVNSQAEALPEAAFWEQAPQPATVAEPRATPSVAPATSGLPGPIAVTIGVSAAVVVFGVGIVFAIRAGHGGLLQPPVPVVLKKDKAQEPVDKGGGGEPDINPKVEPKVQPEPPIVPGNDGGKPKQDQGSAAKQAAKLQMDQAYQVYLVAESVWRQRRDWRAAHAGREKARGMPLIPEELEPAKQRLDQAQLNYDAARRVYQQIP